jgi:membrane-bound metal-dependent hydrolase YbcI (DUF457 family)
MKSLQETGVFCFKINHTLSGIILAEVAVSILYPGLLTTSGISYVLKSKEALEVVAPVVAGSIAGAIFPDIDLHFPGLSHRTLTHWPFPYLVGLLLACCFGHLWLVVFCIGCLVHIFLDSFSMAGVPFVNPFGKRTGFKVFRGGGYFEGIITVFMFAGIYGVWAMAT